MFDLKWSKFYRRLRRLLGIPLKAGKSEFPEGYYLFFDVVEGRMVIKLMRDYGWNSLVIQTFEGKTPISVIKKAAKIHALGELN